MGVTLIMAGRAMRVAAAFLLFTAISQAQVRQTKLFLDDGFGNFSTLSGPSGGGSFSFPLGGGTLITTGNSGAITSVGSISSGVWEGTPIGAGFGGTGLATYTPYALIAGGTTSTGTLQQVSGLGSATQVLTSNGPNQLPSWQTAASGLSNPMTLLGDVIYGGASGTPTELVGNTSSTKKFLRSTGASGVATAPAWDTIAGADVPVFGKSGSSHTTGAVPDPGSTPGTAKFLREDATWAAPSSGSSTMMISGSSQGFGGNSTSYTYPLGITSTSTSTTPDVADGDVMLVNRSGTIKNFTVILASVPNVGKSYPFTIYDGTTSTGVTVTLTNATGATLTDSTHSYSILAGDLISIKFVGSGGETSMNAVWTFDIQ